MLLKMFKEDRLTLVSEAERKRGDGKGSGKGKGKGNGENGQRSGHGLKRKEMERLLR